MNTEKLTIYCVSSIPNLSLKFLNTSGQYSFTLKWLGMLSLKEEQEAVHKIREHY